MQIVIDISEDSYKATCRGSMLPPDVENVVNAIRNGTPLPKGHGKIGDLDRLYSVFEKNVVSADVFKELFDCAPTIIEADKENKE